MLQDIGKIKLTLQDVISTDNPLEKKVSHSECRELLAKYFENDTCNHMRLYTDEKTVKVVEVVVLQGFDSVIKSGHVRAQSPYHYGGVYHELFEVGVDLAMMCLDNIKLYDYNNNGYVHYEDNQGASK